MSEDRPTLIATTRAKQDGRRCDHCKRIVPKGDPIFKLIRACCDNPRHFRPSRRSGGVGSWVCQACVDDLDPAEPDEEKTFDMAVTIPDRDLVREALARFEMPGCLGVDRRTDLDSLVAAARAWLEQENAIITTDEMVKRATTSIGNIDPKGVRLALEAALSVEGDQP